MRVIAWYAFKYKVGNPYNWLLYTHMSKLGVEVTEFSVHKFLVRKYDVWHIHWPESLLDSSNLAVVFVKILSLLALLKVARIRGTKVFWTVHNLRAHECRYPRLEAWLWWLFIRQVDAYISMTEMGKENALEQFPVLRERQGFVVPHGHYREVYPNQMTKAEARRMLNLSPESKVIAFVGQIRPYKNVPQLIQTFRNLDDQQAFLVVAGYPNTSETEQLVKAAAEGESRIQLFLHSVPSENLQLYLNAADLVVLPYRKILNSGSALLALSFDRPVLLPCLGGLRELQELVGTDWVRMYTEDLTTTDLAEALEWAISTSRSQIAPLSKLDWERLAKKTLEAFHAVVKGEASEQTTVGVDFIR